MREKVKPTKQEEEDSAPESPPEEPDIVYPVRRKRGRPKKKKPEDEEPRTPKKRGRKRKIRVGEDFEDGQDGEKGSQQPPWKTPNLPSMDSDDLPAEALHMSTMQVKALSELVSCKACGEAVVLGVRPTTKGMINEFTATCKVCLSHCSTNTPNIIRERKRKREKKGVLLQKTENINYAHVAAFLDNGLGYSGLRHYCRYLNARCLNEATFIVYSRQVISDVVQEAEEFLQQNARIVRKAFESQLENDDVVDLTVAYTTTYHQWGSDFCLVAGAVIELQTGLVLDYDVANMYCHVCKINARRIVNMTPSEMTDWFNKHQDTCEIREWCDEIDQDTEEGVKEIDPKYLEAFIAKKLWGRSVEKFGFRYTTLIHESDEKIHEELFKAAPYGDIPVLIDNVTNCFSRRKSEHARTSFQNKLKSKCPRERVQTKDRIMYVYSMSIPEYNKFAIGSNIKLRGLVKQMEEEELQNAEMADFLPQIYDTRDVQEPGEGEEAVFIDEEGFVHAIGEGYNGSVIDDGTGIEMVDSSQLETTENEEEQEAGEVSLTVTKPDTPKKIKLEISESEKERPDISADADDDRDSITSERDEFLPKKDKKKESAKPNLPNGMGSKDGKKKKAEEVKPYRVELGKD